MRVEWPTLWLVLATYLTWLAGLWAAALWLPLGLVPLTIAIVLHASLQHEVIHGHPLPSRFWSQVLVFPSLNLAVPYLRFRDTHLAHHQDANLTDPYDDPESNYLDPAVWVRMPRMLKFVMRLNNTLAGRLVLGPLIAQVVCMSCDARAIWRGEPGVARAWALHLLTLLPILAIVAVSPMPLWAYVLACYVALSILKIRTFLEHQAHARARGRTVIIEDRGPLAFLFLNNNLHVVHHMHPRVPWYRLPRLYAANKPRYLSQNFGYRYASYAEVFARHFLRAKDPVTHPHFPEG